MLDDTRKQFCTDVLTIALEGGVDYWAVGRNAQRTPDLDYTSIELRDSEDSSQPFHLVNAETIETSVNRIIGGGVKIAEHLKAEIETAWLENDASVIDATTSDVIVQVACFGEIVYG